MRGVRSERILEKKDPVFLRAQFDIGRAEVGRRWCDIEALYPGLADHTGKRRFLVQQLVGGAVAVACGDAQTGRGIALRIEIDDQHLLSQCSQCSPEVDRRGGLAHTALLVRDREYAGTGGIRHVSGSRS